MKSYFDVIPRYSGGSPAMVPEFDARRVIEQERRFYTAYLEGFYGAAGKELAERMDLNWIVWQWWQQGAKIHRRDLITGDELIVPEKIFSRYFPIYSSDQDDFSGIQRYLRMNGIKGELVTGYHTDQNDQLSRKPFQWFMVTVSDLALAEKVLALRETKALPPYLRRNVKAVA